MERARRSGELSDEYRDAATALRGSDPEEARRRLQATGEWTEQEIEIILDLLP